MFRARIYMLLRKRKAEMPGKANYLCVPATQKAILGAFGLDEEWIKTQTRLIGKDIQNAAMSKEQKDDEEY